MLRHYTAQLGEENFRTLGGATPGTTTLSGGLWVRYIEFTNGNDEDCDGHILLPDNWDPFGGVYLSIAWYPDDHTVVGNVRWQFGFRSHANDDPNGSPGYTVTVDQAHTNAALDQIHITPWRSYYENPTSVAGVTAPSWMAISIRRQGSNANDTLATPARMLKACVQWRVL